MSGTPTTAPVDRLAFFEAAREVAVELEGELAQLDRDAQDLELHGFRLFAVQVRNIRGRLARWRGLALAVVKTAPRGWRKTA